MRRSLVPSRNRSRNMRLWKRRSLLIVLTMEVTRKVSSTPPITSRALAKRKHVCCPALAMRSTGNVQLGLLSLQIFHETTMKNFGCQNQRLLIFYWITSRLLTIDVGVMSQECWTQDLILLPVSYTRKIGNL